MSERDEPIDLNKLSQRELLIVLAKDMEVMRKDLSKLDAGQQKMALEVNTLKTRSKTWGAIAGFITGLITILIERLLNP